MAFDSLRQHKTRSLLTVLGVVIGIMAMVAVASIMVGLDRDIRGFLDQYGTDTLFVFRWDFGFRGNLTAEERNRKTLDRKSTRLNFSHLVISYAVFCSNKKRDERFMQVTPPNGGKQAQIFSTYHR